MLNSIPGAKSAERLEERPLIYLLRLSDLRPTAKLSSECSFGRLAVIADKSTSPDAPVV